MDAALELPRRAGNSVQVSGPRGTANSAVRVFARTRSGASAASPACAVDEDSGARTEGERGAPRSRSKARADRQSHGVSGAGSSSATHLFATFGSSVKDRYTPAH